tara:strand:+ start:192 stop:467 length:276 start_codon:yes stop_codon:yes gene_type:complete
MDKTGIYDKLQGKMFSSEINGAIKLHLKESGYYTDNLWHINDVRDRFDCTDEEAYKILDRVLSSEYAVSSIHESICQVAQDEFNLKFKDDE